MAACCASGDLDRCSEVSTASKSLKTFVPRPFMVVLPVPSAQTTMFLGMSIGIGKQRAQIEQRLGQKELVQRVKILFSGASDHLANELNRRLFCPQKERVVSHQRDTTLDQCKERLADASEREVSLLRRFFSSTDEHRNTRPHFLGQHFHRLSAHPALPALI